MPLVDATGRARSLAAAPPHSPSGQSPDSGHPLLHNGGKVPVRDGRRAIGSPADPRPCPAGPPPGSTVGLPCGSGLAFAPACWVGGAWQQAKGGDAWWAARRRAGPGRSASRPDRGSTRAAGAPAGPGPVTPVRAPGRPATGLPGVPRPRPAVLQPRRPAVPGARHRATGGGAQPAVAGQGDDEGRHCPGTGAAMTLPAGRRRRGEQLGWRPGRPYSSR